MNHACARLRVLSSQRQNATPAIASALPAGERNPSEVVIRVWQVE